MADSQTFQDDIPITGIIGAGPELFTSVTVNRGDSLLVAASAGESSEWIPYVPGMRITYALSTGSVTTGFTVDISADGVTSLGQAFSGTWASSTTYEISPPIWLANVRARFIRVNVVSGGPLSVDVNV